MGIDCIRSGSILVWAHNLLRSTTIYPKLSAHARAPVLVIVRTRWIERANCLIFTSQVNPNLSRSTFRSGSPAINQARSRSPGFSLGLIHSKRTLLAIHSQASSWVIAGRHRIKVRNRAFLSSLVVITFFAVDVHAPDVLKLFFGRSPCGSVEVWQEAFPR